jgi:pimeloyl-ACP methyl ester carboxylesterase
VATIEVREGTFTGGLPYLVVGSGEPLVYLCGFTLDHRNPRQGFERTLTLRTLTPLARAGFQVYFTNRWPDMAPGTTFAEIAERHAAAIRDHFGKPVDVLGASTGGSLALQLIADRPDVVRKAGSCLCCVYPRPPCQGDATKASACNFRDRSLSHPGRFGRASGEAPIALAPYVAYASRVCGGLSESRSRIRPTQLP